MKEKIKLIFLDIDGVLNCSSTEVLFQGLLGIEKEKADIVINIIKETSAKVVLSSTWRLHEDLREEVKNKGINYTDITPSCESRFRGDEINLWLADNEDKYEVEKFAVIDDDRDFYDGQHLFKTSWQEGITQEIADRIIEYLNK